MREKAIVSDRYTALGIPHPDPATVCKGQCEGTGFVPVQSDETEEPWRTLWTEAEAASPTDPWNSTHFVRCPDCGGTGKR